MDYERIHKVQTGMVSPSKLRMKLIGVHNQKKKDGSTNNSSRTSPARMEDSEFVKDSLLAGPIGDLVEEDTSLEIQPVSSDASSSYGSLLPSKDIESTENADMGCGRMQVVPKGDGNNCNSSLVHPVRTYEDESLDYDSTSSFEFYKGERSLHQSVTKSLSRPMSSKWNDAEKWIVNRQIVQSNGLKKSNVPNQVNRPSAVNIVRVAPESTSAESKPSVKRVDFCQTTGLAKLAFASHGASSIPLIDHCPDIRDLPEVDYNGLPCSKNVTEETRGIPTIRSVSMRDMGTEMTPIPSQEPSRSATPVTATTPLRSPTSSMPSTPRRSDPAPTPSRHSIANNSTPNVSETGKKELSEQELKLKTRREIVDLGVQLGKMNIAAWASKDEKVSGNRAGDGNDDEIEENAKRAAAWEEAEKAKHAARFKREEIRIQAWESRQKAKLETEMRKVEAQIEQMRAQAQAKMVKKIALARQKSDEKRAAAEARRDKQAEKTAAQVEHICQTGRIPSSFCCGWT